MTAKNWRAFLSSNTANRKLRLTEDEIVRRAAETEDILRFRTSIRWCLAVALFHLVAKKWFVPWFSQHLEFLLGVELGSVVLLLIMLCVTFLSRLRLVVRTESEPDVIEEHASRPNPL